MEACHVNNAQIHNCVSNATITQDIATFVFRVMELILGNAELVRAKTSLIVTAL